MSNCTLRSSLVSAVIMARSSALIWASKSLMVCFRAEIDTVCDDNVDDEDDCCLFDFLSEEEEEEEADSVRWPTVDDDDDVSGRTGNEGKIK